MDIFHGDAKANRNRHFNSFPFFETALRGRYEPGLVPLTMLQLIFLCFDSLDFEQHAFFVNSMNMCKQYAQYYCEAMMLRQICREDKQTVRYKQNTCFFCESWGQYIFHLFGGWELLRLHLPITSKTNSETPFLLGTKGMSFRVSWLFGLRIWEIIVPSSGQEKWCKQHHPTTSNSRGCTQRFSRFSRVVSRSEWLWLIEILPQFMAARGVSLACQFSLRMDLTVPCMTNPHKMPCWEV